MNSLISKYRKVGERHYRETYGVFDEDFEIDDVFEHRGPPSKKHWR